MFDQAVLTSASPAVPQRSRGTARLTVKSLNGFTRIENLYQQGCSKIRIPSGHSAGLEAIMINSSGGMTGGDQLDWEFCLHDETALTITSQACERVYAAFEDIAKTEIKLVVGEHARLAWLPQETILFNHGSFTRSLDVDMATSAELLLVEPIVFGRGAMNEIVTQGFLRDRWRVCKDGRLVHSEDTRFSGDIHDLLQASSVSNGQIAMANLLLIAPRAEGLCDDVRRIIGEFGSASFWQEKLLIRLIAPDSYSLRSKLAPLINLLNNTTPLPKIWTI